MAKHACMVCTTPFQVICCMNIVLNKHNDADLYIINRFNDSESIADEVRGLGLFSNVFHVNSDMYLTEHGHNRVKQRVSLLNTYRKVDQIGLSVLENREYSEVYVSNNAVICRIIYMYLIKKDSNTTLNFFDDGIGTYYDHTTTEASKIEKIYRGVFVSGSLYNIDANYCLFHPDLFMKKHPYIPRDRVTKVPALKIDTEYQELVNKAFFMNNVFSFQEKVVILDTLRKVEFDSEGCEIYGKLLDEICARNEGHYIFKPHPKNKEIDTSALNVFESISTPLECYCFYNDISDKILITNASFSAFTPKLLFDQEPTIIFTYNIMKDHFYDKEVSMREAILDLKEMYRDKGKVLLPNSLDEMWEVLNSKII